MLSRPCFRQVSSVGSDDPVVDVYSVVGLVAEVDGQAFNVFSRITTVVIFVVVVVPMILFLFLPFVVSLDTIAFNFFNLSVP